MRTEPGVAFDVDLLDAAQGALEAASALLDAAKEAVAAKVCAAGKVDAEALEREQRAAHGLAWFEAHRQSLIQMRDWAQRLDDAGKLRALEKHALALGFADYLARLEGGVVMSQGEVARPRDLGLDAAAMRAFADHASVRALTEQGSTPAVRAAIARALGEGDRLDPAFDDDSLELARDQFARLSDEVIAPRAHQWHLDDELVPMDVIEQIADMGVFGLSLPEENGGLGMSKQAMCVVTEELTRGYVGVGSLPTRAEIAAELIRLGGTDDQKARYLPKIAAGAIIPTAVFTEPDTGSDMASLTTRAVKDGDVYRITGAKNWITHAARADLMTVLCRTNPDDKSYRGLSMFLVEKPRGTDAEPFPLAGMQGSEIPVLGYRGMKEYALAFDGLETPAASLLGGVEGQGFKQLMATFESARIQTAARAVGVAQNAFELGLAYALDRKQFQKPLIAFPRVGDKLAWMAVEIEIGRQLTLFAARRKDRDQRTDLEAGLAKLLSAQIAWSAADNALQIHGGNGYATEYRISRVLCDARILNIFEGAAEIQAQVIARRLLAE